MEKQIGAAQFKARCLALLEALPDEGLVVTKHGRRIARVLPYREGNADLLGALSNSIEIVCDLESTGVDWNASSR